MNAKHEAFAKVFAETGSVTKAALAAGYDKHLSSRGSDLLKRPDVADRVRELVKARLADTGELAMGTVKFTQIERGIQEIAADMAMKILAFVRLPENNR